MTQSEPTPPLAGTRALAALRDKAPLVQCITNYVAMNQTANVLLAAGAAPAMVHAPQESGEFAAIADALTVNIGTLSPAWVDGMRAAVNGATGAGKPWVLDPVAHFATPYRANVAADLLLMKPTILRGNASEIMALTGADSAGRGVDSGDAVVSAIAPARAVAARSGAVVIVTGAQDFITDGTRAVTVSGGSPLMTQVTATGCAMTGLLGAFAAVCDDPMEAAVACCLMFSVAGERAARQADGPGSFAWRFLDSLAAIHPGDLDADRVSRA